MQNIIPNAPGEHYQYDFWFLPKSYKDVELHDSTFPQSVDSNGFICYV